MTTQTQTNILEKQRCFYLTNSLSENCIQQSMGHMKKSLISVSLEVKTFLKILCLFKRCGLFQLILIIFIAIFILWKHQLTTQSHYLQNYSKYIIIEKITIIILQNRFLQNLVEVLWILSTRYKVKYDILSLSKQRIW